jgi:glutamate dehydrogenase
MRIAVARHTSPRLNSMAYPESRLGPRGFRIPRVARPVALPDGTVVEDGAFLHRRFLVSPQMRPYIQQANIRAFVPCGGFKDTINAENVGAFMDLFRELRVIVEGANVFFDDTARETIARKTGILQIRDSSANKGGVTSSSIAEVLTAFLLGDGYERMLVRNPRARSALIRAVLDLIRANAEAETKMLLALHRKTGDPLYALSVRTSEQLFALQARLYERLDAILRQRPVVEAVLRAYVPHALLDHLGMPRVLRALGSPELRAYRDALLTKKLAAMALYRHAADWDEFLKRFDADLPAAVRAIVRAD